MAPLKRVRSVWSVSVSPPDSFIHNLQYAIDLHVYLSFFLLLFFIFFFQSHSTNTKQRRVFLVDLQQTLIFPYPFLYYF